MYFDALSKKYKFYLTEPWKRLSDEAKNIILYGTKGETLELHYDQPRGKGVLKQAFEGKSFSEAALCLAAETACPDIASDICRMIQEQEI